MKTILCCNHSRFSFDKISFLSVTASIFPLPRSGNLSIITKYAGTLYFASFSDIVCLAASSSKVWPSFSTMAAARGTLPTGSERVGSRSHHIPARLHRLRGDCHRVARRRTERPGVHHPPRSHTEGQCMGAAFLQRCHQVRDSKTISPASRAWSRYMRQEALKIPPAACPK